MKDKIIPGKLLQPNMKVRRIVDGTPTGLEIKVIDSIYFNNSVYFKEKFLVVAENCDELQQAIQDAILEDRKQTIESLENLKCLYSDRHDGLSVIKGITAVQDYIRVLNEREG
jgi:hypothetical protein